MVLLRAVHLELTNNLSADSLIIARPWFKSRLEHVQVIRSDNCTNFHDAALELKDTFKIIDWSKGNCYCYEQKVDFQWIFHPHFIPWIGGRLGVLIKSIKRVLRAVTFDRVFTNLVLHTFICETECIINQCPLTAISDDVNYFDTFTPNHFLTGEAHPNQPLGEFSSKEINYPQKGEQFQRLPIFYWITGERNISRH